MSQFSSSRNFSPTASPILVGVLVSLLLNLQVKSQTVDQKKIDFPVEMREYTLTVVDDDGTPISGATVEAAGVRCLEDPGSWYGWPVANAGNNNRLVSDDQGHITLKYPLKYGRPPTWRTTSKIDFMCSHPLYVANRVEVDPEGGAFEHIMHAGCEVLFSAVDESNQPIEKFGTVMAGPGGRADWVLKNGEIRTRSIPDGLWQTMLVAPGSDGAHLYSGILPAKFAKGRPVTIRGIKLSPGLTVRGKLDDQVPRPVTDGRIVAFCLPKPSGPVHEDQDPSLSWSDCTNINADGSFVFKSLPPTGTVQLIAVCRGWIVRSEPRDEVSKFFVQGAQINLDQSKIVDRELAIDLPMEPAGSVEVTITQPDGRPLIGANVSTSPNQMLDKSGSQVVGRCYSSMSLIQAKLDGNEHQVMEQLAKENRQSRYTQTTDANGRVVLHDLPINGFPHRLRFSHPAFNAIAKSGTSNSDEFDEKPNPTPDLQFELPSAERKIIELVAVPIEKQAVNKE